VQSCDEDAERMGLSGAVVEKDFWVCWSLKQIFSIEQFRVRLLFKGGTSQSKVFGAIQRFLEDIDLAVDYALLGFTGDRDPATGRPFPNQTVEGSGRHVHSLRTLHSRRSFEGVAGPICRNSGI
jgi:hypothetical protein